MIYILSEPIRSGKTTVLKSWAEARNGVGGFLSPDRKEVRFLYRLGKSEFHPFEIKDPSEEIIQTIGKFHFLDAGFAQAKEWIVEDLKNPAIQWVIIDEIGKLELKKQGFHTLLPLIKANPQVNYILVIRDSLLAEIIDFYELKDHKVIQIQDLAKIS